MKQRINNLKQARAEIRRLLNKIGYDVTDGCVCLMKGDNYGKVERIREKKKVTTDKTR